MTPAFCPECGSPLTVNVEENNETGNIEITLYCDGPGEDEYELQINTHLKKNDLTDWDQENSTKNATMTLFYRKPAK